MMGIPLLVKQCLHIKMAPMGQSQYQEAISKEYEYEDISMS